MLGTKSPFYLYDFLCVQLIKDRLLRASVVFPVHKELNLTKESKVSLTGERTTWKITTSPKWTVRRGVIVPEVSTLLLTPTKFTQWPTPRVPPLIEKFGEGEVLITFFGYENWDTYLGSDKPLC